MSGDPSADPLASALQQAGRVVEHTPAIALEHARRAAGLAATRGDAASLAWARLHQSRALSYIGRLDEGFGMAVEVLAEFTGLGEDAGVAYAAVDVGAGLADRGDAAGARAALDRGIAAARRSGDAAAELELLQNRGAVSLIEGDRARAREECLIAIARAEVLGDTCEVAHLNLALIDLEELSEHPHRPDRDARVAQAVEHADRAVERCSRERFRAVQALALQAEALAWAGLGSRCVAVGRSAVHLSAELGDEVAAFAWAGLAAALSADGRHPEALDAAARAMGCATSGGDPWLHAMRVGELVRTGVFGSR